MTKTVLSVLVCVGVLIAAYMWVCEGLLTNARRGDLQVENPRISSAEARKPIATTQKLSERTVSKYLPEVASSAITEDASVENLSSLVQRLAELSSEQLREIEAEVLAELERGNWIALANTNQLDVADRSHLENLLNRESAVKILLLERQLKHISSEVQ